MIFKFFLQNRNSIFEYLKLKIMKKINLRLLLWLFVVIITSACASKSTVAGGSEVKKTDSTSMTEKQEGTKKDGLSLETAIKVKGIDEEYKYVRNNCDNCQMQGQALLQHKGKPYDKLMVKNAKGEVVSYYFDISSFFGKW